MPLRHTIYSNRSFAAVTPEMLFKHLDILDFWTLGEGYDMEEDAVNASLPLRIENLNPGQFHSYRLVYGKADKRPIDIHRWETEEIYRGVIDETIDNLTIPDKARVKKVSDLLRKSVDSVSVTFGIDPPAAMYAWEVVRYFASEFKGFVHADDGEWLTIGSDHQARPI